MELLLLLLLSLLLLLLPPLPLRHRCTRAPPLLAAGRRAARRTGEGGAARPAAARPSAAAAAARAVGRGLSPPRARAPSSRARETRLLSSSCSGTLAVFVDAEQKKREGEEGGVSRARSGFCVCALRDETRLELLSLPLVVASPLTTTTTPARSRRLARERAESRPFIQSVTQSVSGGSVGAWSKVISSECARATARKRRLYLRAPPPTPPPAPPAPPLRACATNARLMPLTNAAKSPVAARRARRDDSSGTSGSQRVTR